MRRFLVLFLLIPIVFTTSCVGNEVGFPSSSNPPTNHPQTSTAPSTETAAGAGEAINITNKKDKDQITKNITPIIIVPGIMASELMYNDSKIWPPFPEMNVDFSSLTQLQLLTYTNKLFNSLNLMTYSSDAISQYAVSPVQLSPVGTIIQDNSYNIGANNTYFKLAQSLAMYYGSNNVFFFGYDWRASVMDSGDKLAEYIDFVCQVTGQNKVHLVAHSMGGLVTTAYLLQTKEIKVDKVVTAGTPFGGADKATALLLGGDFSGLLADYIGNSSEEQAGKIEEITQFLSSVSEILFGLTKSYPSVYTLVPAQSEVLLLKHNTTAAKFGFGDRKTLNNNYEQLWSKVDHYNVVGTGHEAVSFDISDSEMKQGKADGDGTVTKDSATYGGLFSDITEVFNATHTGLVSDETCVCHIVELLKK